MKKKISLLFVLVAVGFLAVAQPGWNWPEDKATAEEKNVLYSDNMKMENYAGAVEPLEWLLQNAPNLNKSIYINGAKIYEALADAEKDTNKKLQFVEKALSMYDQRIKYFGEEAEVLNRKAYNAYRFYRDTQSKYPELKALFDKAFEMNGADIFDNNLVAYMDVVRRFKLSGGKMTDEEVIDKYTYISDIVAEKSKKGGNEKRYLTITDNLDKLLTATVTVDCNFVESTLGPKMRANGDVKMAKKVVTLMLTGKCTDSPLFVEAAKIVHKAEPNFGMAKVIAIKAGIDGDVASAEKYYNEALDLAEDNSKKAEIYYNMAQLYASNGQKVAARNNARKALATDPSMTSAYTLIGDLYMNSFNECKEGKSPVADRAVFIAAYNMYVKGGDSQRIASAKSQFPSIEEMFNENLSEGQSMTVGCWINETVSLQRRPQ